MARTGLFVQMCMVPIVCLCNSILYLQKNGSSRLCAVRFRKSREKEKKSKFHFKVFETSRKDEICKFFPIQVDDSEILPLESDHQTLFLRLIQNAYVRQVAQETNHIAFQVL